MKGKLFINYRREDTAPYAGRLYDRLTAHFGEDQVFIDIDQIDPGEDFVEVINRKVSACDIAIVSIGPRWLSATDASGKRRLDDDEDFVRMEIVAALERNIRVIPVLVGGAQMPRKQDLPEALASLSRRNAIELSETRFHADVNRLIEAIEKSFAVAEKKTELSATPIAPAKGLTTPVKSTQTAQSRPAIPPVASISAIAASKEPAVWRRKRLIIVTALGATGILLLLLTIRPLLTRPQRSLTRSDPLITTPHPSVGPSAEILLPAKVPKSDSQSVSSAEAAKRVQADMQPHVPTAIYTPKPAYPAEWAKQGLTGKGVVLVTIDKQTGKVIGAQMLQSTGNMQLDDSALEAYSQWRFDPRTVTVSQLKIPIEFGKPRAP
jgi:TonB family protein